MNIDKIKRLLYLRKELDNRIDNIITEELLRNKEPNTEKIRDTLNYCIDDNLSAFEQGR